MSALGTAERLSKLRAMTPREVLTRARYAAAVAVERRSHRSGRLVRDGLPRALRDAFRGRDWQTRLLVSRKGQGPRFLPSTRDRDGMRQLFTSAYQRELRDTLHYASLASAHRFEFFGREFTYGRSIDWQADPVSGRRWPSVFHADVPVHRGDTGCGDVKYVWELNRQQCLIDLGKAYYLTGEYAYVASLRSLVQSWVADNAYATGVNWACALEPAFRALSWLWAYHLTLDALDDEFHVEWLGAFHDHGRFLYRHLEHYSSPYNHLIGEAAALYMLGVSFPEFRDAEQWRTRGRAVLEARLAEQFYEDGGSVEQSLFYHHATVGYYLLAALTARAAGDEPPDRIWRAIERGIAFSAAMVQPDGRTPEIGGADDGKPIRMEHLPFWDFRPYQAVGAVLFGRSDFKSVAGRFFEDALWLLGADGLARFEGLPAGPRAQESVALEGSGYYLLRSRETDAADYVCIDCGEQAAGMRTDAVPNSMHGHADCLSVLVWLGGRRLLVDSGFYAYNCGGQWEAHFRETAAHNTARVDRRDQALHLGKMVWSHSYRAACEEWAADARQGWFVGSHDGYARGMQGVTHRRAVWLRDGAYLVILDEFRGRGEHDLEVNFQFAPGTLRGEPRGCTAFDEAVDTAWTGSAHWAGEIRQGGPSPADGWVAPSLGVLQPAPRLTVTTTSSAARTTLLTALALRAGAGPRVSVVDSGRVGQQPMLRVAGDDYTDLVVTSNHPDVDCIATDALIAICRLRPGRTPEVERIAGTYATVNAKALTHLDAEPVMG